MSAPAAHDAAKFMMVHAANVVDPSGGATVDVEGRAAVVSALAAMRKANLLTGAGAVVAAPAAWDATNFTLVHGAAIANPTGGATQDANARTAINGILQALRDGSVIAGVRTPTGPAQSDPVDRAVKYGAAIANVSAGATIDAELRIAINNGILPALRSANFIVS